MLVWLDVLDLVVQILKIGTLKLISWPFDIGKWTIIGRSYRFCLCTTFLSHRWCEWTFCYNWNWHFLTLVCFINFFIKHHNFWPDVLKILLVRNKIAIPDKNLIMIVADEILLGGVWYRFQIFWHRRFWIIHWTNYALLLRFESGREHIAKFVKDISFLLRWAIFISGLI